MEVIYKNPRRIYQVDNIYYGKKELVESYIGLNGHEKIVEALVYVSRNHRPYVSTRKTAYGFVEVKMGDVRPRSGVCKIADGNYRRFPSVVVIEAFKNAGIEFSENIEGGGTESIKRCIVALLQYLGCENPIVTSTTNR